MKIKILRKEKKQNYESFEELINKVLKKIEKKDMSVFSFDTELTEGVLTVVIAYE